MSLNGNNSPNHVVTTEPRPNFEVLSGTIVEETAPAKELTRRLVLAWLEGLRDMQNPLLAPFQEETARSRVSSSDVDARYGVIVSLAQSLNVAPVNQAEFIRLFLPSAAPALFVSTLLRLGIELNFADDFAQLDREILAYRNPVQPVLTGLQENTNRTINPAAVAALLEEIDHPSLVETTQHFVDDYVENDALDADSKAHERIYQTFAEYVRRLLLLKT